MACKLASGIQHNDSLSVYICGQFISVLLVCYFAFLCFLLGDSTPGHHIGSKCSPQDCRRFVLLPSVRPPGVWFGEWYPVRSVAFIIQWKLAGLSHTVH